jgi:signal peptidase I
MAAVSWGKYTAIALIVLNLVAALWNPLPRIVPILVFIAVALGLRKGNSWSGYGGALYLVASIGGVVLSATESIPWAELGSVGVIYALAAFALLRAGHALGMVNLKSAVGWIVVAVGAFAFPFLFRPFVIPTSAMENTVLIGDHVLVRMLGLPSPARGDLVVFQSPSDPKTILMKRVIAIGGDRLRLSNKRVLLNGVEQVEPYVLHLESRHDPFRDNFPQEPTFPLPNAEWGAALARHIVGGEVVVPNGMLFVMGDNRERSLDSRYLGFVEEGKIIGKPELIYFSSFQTTDSSVSNSIPSPPLLNPDRVRWSRLLMRF